MKSYIKYISSIIILCFTFTTYANIVYSGTRFIYNEKDKNIIIKITNKNESTAFLLQSKITGKDNGKTPFIISPPLFKFKPNQESILKITKIKPLIVTDRESVFYLNSKAIPVSSSNESNLHISLKSVFKLFYRPSGLTETINDAKNKVHFLLNKKNELIIENKSEYHFTILSVFTEKDKKEIATMIAPFSTLNVGYVPFNTEKLKWSYVNDFGNEVNVDEDYNEN